jgi:hypothetical protein
MNKAVAGSELESKTLEELVVSSWNSGNPTPVFNNAAQASLMTMHQLIATHPADASADWLLLGSSCVPVLLKAAQLCEQCMQDSQGSAKSSMPACHNKAAKPTRKINIDIAPGLLSGHCTPSARACAHCAAHAFCCRCGTTPSSGRA